MKICDFGVAEELDPYSFSDSVRGSQGAPMFVAPEIAIGMDTVSGRKLDVWSTGNVRDRTGYPVKFPGKL